MKYILAISGGVDSVVLLEKAAQREILTDAVFPDDFIVAHFDHGIRGVDSTNDAEFVRELAADYGVKFVLEQGNLPADCNEQTAREKRHDFLRDAAAGQKIVTAHHSDDLLETIIINLIRGTGWRGLAPMYNERIVRPLLDMTKTEIVQYAIENDLKWVEDETNFSSNYFRNRVRDFMIQIPTTKRRQFVELYEKQKKLRDEIEAEIAKYDNLQLSRKFLIEIPEIVAIEILRTTTDGRLTYPQLNRLLNFVKTAKAHKRTEYGKLKITVTNTEVKLHQNVVSSRA
ncbi:tRNA lysidine(34) synthetase TilS [Candidatus Saccharibacteria bacterium]|nr:tRNA lysidine(34) synthetase TilS [Candidatus Saccharibacteria bacterium]MCL1963249.1 tRNA lysidine(34) synthetase TilS [Candidatus Saccharibacteria bacterium]